MSEQAAKVTSVAVARAYVTRADGTREVHYSREVISAWREPRRWLKLQRHLRFMRNEDRRTGWR